MSLTPADNRAPILSPTERRDICARWPVEWDSVYGCLLWQGTIDRDGYGVKWHGRGKPTAAHRAVYEAMRGPIPANKPLDHLCRRRHCVSPAHLEPVTQRVNIRRRAWSQRAGQRRCRAGHDLYLRGRRTPEGGIVCRDCSGVK